MQCIGKLNYDVTENEKMIKCTVLKNKIMMSQNIKKLK